MSQNFSRQNLRGRSFKGEDLTDANFSYADIRSADFTGATLRGANFSHANAGLQKRWATILTLVSLLLSGLSGLISGQAGYVAAQGFYTWQSSNQIASWTVITTLVTFCGITIRQGIQTGLGVLAGAFVLAGIIAVTGVASLFVIGTAAFIGIGAVAAAGAGAVVGAVVGAFAFAGAVIGAIAGVVAGILIVGGANFFPVSFSFAGAIVSLSIYISWRAMKGDEKHAIVRNIAIAFAACGGTSFRNADLTDAIFTGATLRSTDFRRAILIRTNFHKTKMLDRVRPGRTYLQDRQVRQLVITGDGKNKTFDRLDLRGLNLCKADLENASFIDADFYQATLQKANLSGAILVRTQFERADLREASLTGSCIQDWIITNSTKLDGVICEYVYLGFNGKDKIDQMPPRGNFKEGEFILFIKSILDTIDIYHDKNINPKLALAVLRKMSTDYHENLDVVAIGKKGENIFIKVRVPKNLNPEKIKKDYYDMYNEGNRFSSKESISLPIDKEIENRISEITSQSSDDDPSVKVTYIEYINTSSLQFEREASVENISSNYNLEGAKIGAFAGTGGQASGTFYDYSSNINYSSKQNLSEVAVEIQQVLAQLQSQGDSAEDATHKVASDLAKQAQTNPTLKERLVKWGRHLGDAAANGLIGEAAVEVLKLALRLAGIPVP